MLMTAVMVNRLLQETRGETAERERRSAAGSGSAAAAESQETAATALLRLFERFTHFHSTPTHTHSS